MMIAAAGTGSGSVRPPRVCIVRRVVRGVLGRHTELLAGPGPQVCQLAALAAKGPVSVAGTVHAVTAAAGTADDALSGIGAAGVGHGSSSCKSGTQGEFKS